MKKYEQSSIWDSLLMMMPGIKTNKNSEHVDPVAAKYLYDIWRTAKKFGGKIFEKPVSLGRDEVARMKNAGLIHSIQNKIEITAKGEKILKIMILGDERSIFEDDGKSIDYHVALNNIKGVKTAKNVKAAKNEKWWDRFEF